MSVLCFFHACNISHITDKLSIYMAAARYQNNIRLFFLCSGNTLLIHVYFSAVTHFACSFPCGYFLLLLTIVSCCYRWLTAQYSSMFTLIAVHNSSGTGFFCRMTDYSSDQEISCWCQTGRVLSHFNPFDVVALQILKQPFISAYANITMYGSHHVTNFLNYLTNVI
jgi:hypothetical protein